MSDLKKEMAEAEKDRDLLIDSIANKVLDLVLPILDKKLDELLSVKTEPEKKNKKSKDDA